MAAERVLHPSDRMRIVSGLFEGYDDIFNMNLSGKERLQVLIRYLQDTVCRMEIERISLAKKIEAFIFRFKAYFFINTIFDLVFYNQTKKISQ